MAICIHAIIILVYPILFKTSKTTITTRVVIGRHADEVGQIGLRAEDGGVRQALRFDEALQDLEQTREARLE